MVTNALGMCGSGPTYDVQGCTSVMSVKDHCAAIDLVIHKGVAGEVYNVGGHNERTNNEIVRLIVEKLDVSKELIKFVEDRLGHDLRYAIDPTKIETDLGWKPKYTFDTGIIEVIQWYVDNEKWWKNIKSGAYMSYYKNNMM